jgi:hypothetical protein
MATGKNPAGPFEPAGHKSSYVFSSGKSVVLSVVSRPLSVVLAHQKQLTTDH